MYGLSRIRFALALGCGLLAGADEKAVQRPADPELTALQEQNAIMEQRIKLSVQQQTLLRSGQPAARPPDAAVERHENVTIESLRNAYMALAGVAPEVAKDLNCAGKNVVLYGSAQSETLFELRAFTAQLESLRAAMKSVLDAPAPDPSGSAVSLPVSSAPVLQTVLNIVSLFRAGTPSSPDVPVDERGVVALVAKAATTLGCLVYWPDQFSINPFNPASQLNTALQSIADLNDNGGGAGKPAGLQQKLLNLRKELNRAEAMAQAAKVKIEKEQAKLAEASAKTNAIRAQVNFIAEHVTDVKDAALQEKLNSSFDKSWQEMENAIRAQNSSKLPGTIEDVGRAGEMSKRLDVLKARTDFLSKYVADTKNIALQDKLKRFLTLAWDQLDAATKTEQASIVSVSKAIEPDVAEQRRWEKYSADLKDHIRATIGASEGHSTFRGALFDGGSGSSPLSRLLRAEAVRDLTFDEKLQERPGASIVQLKVQRLTGTHLVPPNPARDNKERDSFSGGVVLSFMQYTPGGKLKNSGVHSAYTGFKQQ